MENSVRSREDLLADWKEQKVGRLLGGLTNITNTAQHQPSAGGKLSVTFAAVSEVVPDAKNPAAATASNPAALRKPALNGAQREQMEQQFDALQGRLHCIKRDSRRASITGALPARPAAPTATEPDVGPPAAQAQPAAPQPTTTHEAATDGQATSFGGIASRFESLKRDSLHPALAGAVPQPAQFEAAGQYDMQALSRLAQHLFGDREFLALCERGMSAQLTRSKDGATEETKIKELAGMVKVLRRGMKELQQRAQVFVDQSVRAEREAAQQVEGVRLASESALMAAQAEAANARCEAATEAANHKAALASWQGELDLHRSEAATLRREVERVEAERERAREEARRCDAGRAALEGELREARKALAQRDRDLQVDRNAAVQAAYEAREAGERLRTALAEALAAAEARGADAEVAAAAAQEQLAAAQEQLAAAQGAAAKVQGELEETAARRDALAAECSRLHKELAAQRQEHDRTAADGAAVLAELAEWQEKAAALLAELERERAAAVELRAAAEEAAAAQEVEAAAWAHARAGLGAAAEAAAQRERALADEKAQLKEALAGALQQRGAAEAATLEARQRLADAQLQADALSGERRELSTQLVALRAEADAEARRAEEAEVAAARAAREAEGAASRLARLEGELEALQECTMGLEGGDQRQLLNRMVSKIAALEAAVAGAEARRREAHNALVELKGNIRVFCRIRPHPTAVAAPGPDGASVRLLADGKDHGFAFDRVFHPEASQAAVFEEVSDLVQSALDGYKVCLFSYGQTGAGKTFTMQGGGAPGSEGIIPRSVAKILSAVAALREQGWEYCLEAAYIEVYNEQLRDLLVEPAPGRREGARAIAEGNAIQHQPNGGHTVVLGATRLPVACEADAAALVRRAAAARSTESTAMNAASSRSHSVFMLYTTGRHEATGTVLHGSLNLVDLAGSERLGRSLAEGQRAKEACSINKSLSALGDVFQALAAKQPHVPYRNSKLTHLLQPCLGGSGKTLMFVNINPEPESAAESLCSLRFAAKVNGCETAARGGATRSVTSAAAADGFGFGSGFGFGFDGRPSLTGRPSIAPTGRPSFAMSGRPSICPPTGRPSVAPGDRRMSMIPSATGGGVKRKAPGPVMPPPACRITRPKFETS